MRVAIEEAKIAKDEGNRPFGAILVKDGQIVAKAHNTVLKDNDPAFPLTETDLVDVTANLIQDGTDQERADTQTALDSHEG